MNFFIIISSIGKSSFSFISITPLTTYNFSRYISTDFEDVTGYTNFPFSSKTKYPLFLSAHFFALSNTLKAPFWLFASVHDFLTLYIEDLVFIFGVIVLLVATPSLLFTSLAIYGNLNPKYGPGQFVLANHSCFVKFPLVSPV